MRLILGIDPGSRITGYAVVGDGAGVLKYIASGCIRTQADYFPDRLKQIFDGVGEVIAEHAPDELAIEQVFVHKNADSALKLGQARGAAICSALSRNLPVYEYAAREVKQALVGKGNAEKSQVQHMVKILLGVKGEIQIDAGDALGVCLCHAHHQQTRRRLRQGGGK
ncbi:MAG: crossover junction endodeoxyribonuclease RuvC [Gammaproteobacteria bacterium]